MRVLRPWLRTKGNISNHSNTTLVKSIERLDRNPRILDSSILPLPPTFRISRSRIPRHPRPTQHVAQFVLDERSTRHRLWRGIFLNPLVIERHAPKRVNEYRVLGSFDSSFDSPRIINVRGSLERIVAIVVLQLSGDGSFNDVSITRRFSFSRNERLES